MATVSFEEMNFGEQQDWSDWAILEAPGSAGFKGSRF
jgi:hypothetical protein